MKLHGEGRLLLDRPFSTYWEPWQKQQDKKDLTVREVLAHQAGLTPYIIFLNEVTKKNGKLKKRWVRNTTQFKIQCPGIHDDLYINNALKRKYIREISKSKVSEEKKYKYSGLTFLLYPQLVENMTGMEFYDEIPQNPFL